MEWWIPLTITGSNTGVCMSHTSNIRNQQDEENRGNNHETLRLLEEDTAADQRKTWHVREEECVRDGSEFHDDDKIVGHRD